MKKIPYDLEDSKKAKKKMFRELFMSKIQSRSKQYFLILRKKNV